MGWWRVSRLVTYVRNASLNAAEGIDWRAELRGREREIQKQLPLGVLCAGRRDAGGARFACPLKFGLWTNTTENDPPYAHLQEEAPLVQVEAAPRGLHLRQQRLLEQLAVGEIRG